jgi:hypothetical protein
VPKPRYEVILWGDVVLKDQSEPFRILQEGTVLGPEVAGGATHRASDTTGSAHVLSCAVCLLLGQGEIEAFRDQTFCLRSSQGTWEAHVHPVDEFKWDLQFTKALAHYCTTLSARLEA